MAWPGAFTQIGICHRPVSARAASIDEALLLERDGVWLPSQATETSSSGTPGWLTNVGRIRSTGLPELDAIDFEKSSEVALP